MALQFILGPARSGKTTYIYDRIIRESMEKPDQGVFPSGAGSVNIKCAEGTGDETSGPWHYEY